ncbi:MAG: acylphosphatase [Anaerolineae bacterium]
MADERELQRVHVWVKGRVQGVGFRAHVQFSARQIGVTGWVRNVGYDTVEAVAEGERVLLDRFVEVVKAGPRGARVDESNVEWQNATGEYADFQMRRSL